MKKESYVSLQNELDEVIAKLESESMDIDKAMELHKQAQDILAKLQLKIKTAKNQIKDIGK